MAPEKPLTPRPDEKLAAACSDQGARGMLKRALSRAYWAILWERLWPALASVLTAIGFFIAVSWTGLWLILPPLARAVVLFGALLLIAISAVPLFRFRLPREADGLRRLDRVSGLAHRPATAVADELATDRNDHVAQVLWQAHVERARRAVRAFKAGLPTPGLAARDPVALRALVAVLLVATFFAAGSERGKRLLAAFDWSGVVPAANFRIDAWVTPPAYTARPPLILPGVRGGEPVQSAGTVEVPAGSVLVVRATSSAGLEVSTGGGLAEGGGDAKGPVPAGTDEKRFTIKDSGTATVRGALSEDITWTFRAVPDRPPTITLVKEPEAQARGGLHLVYRLEDDYGVVSARAPRTALGGLVVQRIVTQSDRTVDLLKQAVLGAPALEHDVVGLVASDGKSVVGASVHWAARLPQVSADPARVKPALL